MSSPAVAFYVSGHGFGHSSRVIEVIHALRRLNPATKILVRTSAPRWLFDLTLTTPVEFTAMECDTGVAQIDSLRLDADETIRRAGAFHATLDARADAEARALVDAGVSLVVGDIPPLAMVAAERAEVPGIALGNFTWDWIYSGYPDALPLAPDLLETMRRAYRRATLALRLPLFGGFEVFGPRVRDVPFVARRSRFDRAAARDALGLSGDRPVVLVSFGGYGMTAPDPARRQADLKVRRHVREGPGDYTLVVTRDPKWGQSPFPETSPVPISAGAAAETSTVPVSIDVADLYRRGLRYEDLVAAADVVVTKPGYGIVSECIANQTAMLYTSRGHFLEYDVFVAAMPRYLRCRFIGHEDLFSGDWAPHLERLLKQPPPPERPRTDGAEVVAKILVDYL